MAGQKELSSKLAQEAVENLISWASDERLVLIDDNQQKSAEGALVFLASLDRSAFIVISGIGNTPWEMARSIVVNFDSKVDSLQRILRDLDMSPTSEIAKANQKPGFWELARLLGVQLKA